MLCRRKGLASVVILVTLLLAACHGGGSGGPSVAPSSGPTTPEPTQAGSPPKPLKSAQVGGKYWAVYVIVTNRSNAPETHLAEAELQNFHISSYSEKQVKCDKGAAQALGVSAKSYTVVVYFKKQTDAEAFNEALSSPGAGVAQVKITCT